jgi:hypothetical protein
MANARNFFMRVISLFDSDELIVICDDIRIDMNHGLICD